MSLIYLIECKSDYSTFKIGKTKNLNQRLKQLSTGNSEELKIINSFNTKYPSKLESYLHNYFSTKRKHGEWFDLNKNDVSQFQTICNDFEKRHDFLIKNNTYLNS